MEALNKTIEILASDKAIKTSAFISWSCLGFQVPGMKGLLKYPMATVLSIGMQGSTGVWVSYFILNMLPDQLRPVLTVANIASTIYSLYSKRGIRVFQISFNHEDNE